jgi:hypothetical protein
MLSRSLFAKAVDEESALARLQQDHDAEPAGLAATFAGDPLLDHAAAEIRIDQPSLDIR